MLDTQQRVEMGLAGLGPSSLSCLNDFYVYKIKSKLL